MDVQTISSSQTLVFLKFYRVLCYVVLFCVAVQFCKRRYTSYTLWQWLWQVHFGLIFENYNVNNSVCINQSSIKNNFSLSGFLYYKMIFSTSMTFPSLILRVEKWYIKNRENLYSLSTVVTKEKVQKKQQYIYTIRTQTNCCHKFHTSELRKVKFMLLKTLLSRNFAPCSISKTLSNYNYYYTKKLYSAQIQASLSQRHIRGNLLKRTPA